MDQETFYFCANLPRATEWWKRPLSSLIWDLTDWHPEEEAPHGDLLDEVSLQNKLLPQLRALRDEFGAGPTLGQLTELTVGQVQGSAGPATALWNQNIPRQVAFERLITLCRIYSQLVEAARRGPLNDPLEMRITDTLFARWLARFLPEHLATMYDLSLPANHKVLAPRELSSLTPEIRQQVESRLNVFIVDAARVARQWEQLDRISAFWDRLARELDERMVAYVQGVGVIAGFADEMGLTLLKVVI